MDWSAGIQIHAGFAGSFSTAIARVIADRLLFIFII